jgi:hypothetical protein
MPILRFNPYHGIWAYSSEENSSQSPLKENDQVKFRIVFAYAFSVSAKMRDREDLRGTGAKEVATLFPKGFEFDDRIRCQVTTLEGEERIHLLDFSSDKDNVLQAVLTDTDPSLAFPLQPGEIVTAPFVVKRVKQMVRNVPGDPAWQIVFLPLGEETGGLIVVEVALTS